MYFELKLISLHRSITYFVKINYMTLKSLSESMHDRISQLSSRKICPIGIDIEIWNNMKNSTTKTQTKTKLSKTISNLVSFSMDVRGQTLWM